jgi:hypothetical protein
MDAMIRAEVERIRRIATEHGARNIRVFGSQLTDQLRPDSDLDLLIDLAEGRNLLDIVAIKQDLEELLGRRVDVVTEAALSPYIRDEVLATAKPL